MQWTASMPAMNARLNAVTVSRTWLEKRAKMTVPPAVSNVQRRVDFVPIRLPATVRSPSKLASYVRISVNGVRNNVMRMTWIIASVVPRLAAVALLLAARWRLDPRGRMRSARRKSPLRLCQDYLKKFSRLIPIQRQSNFVRPLDYLDAI